LRNGHLRLSFGISDGLKETGKATETNSSSARRILFIEKQYV